MPYINLSTSRTLSPQDKSDIFEIVNKNITLLPGKTPEVTMINLHDSCSMQKGHNEVPCIFVEARLYKQSPEADKATFVAEFSKALSAKLNVDLPNIYLNIIEFDAWGSNGAYRA